MKNRNKCIIARVNVINFKLTSKNTAMKTKRAKHFLKAELLRHPSIIDEFALSGC